MPRRGSRQKVAPGIYRDSYGYEAIVGRSGPFKQVSRRYPPDTPIPLMQRWQLDVRADRLTERPQGSPRGTLEADAPRYLRTLPERSARRRDASYLLRHWLRTPLAKMRRHEITRADIKAQLATWEAAGVAASTLNHRLQALRNVYKELDGPHVPNPTDGISRRREPEAEPRGIPIVLAEAILEQFRQVGKKDQKRDGEMALRLRVMLTTGLSQSQVERLRRHDVNFAAGRFYARARRKGKGAAGAWLPLLPQAKDALSAYDAAGLWERPFSRSSMHSAFARAVAKVLKTAKESGVELHLPRKLRPYDLRHAFGTEVYRATGDQRAAQALLQHADIRTTRRYTEGAVDFRAEEAIRLVAAHWKPPSTSED